MSKQPHDQVISGGTPDEAALDFDDDEIFSGRGKVRSNGTTQAAGGDSGKIAPPGEQLSDSNGPSDPKARKKEE